MSLRDQHRPPGSLRERLGAHAAESAAGVQARELLDGERGVARAALAWMVLGFLVWAAVFLVLQGQDGFFAAPADRFEETWWSLLVLNVPLQLALTVVSIGCLAARSPLVLRAGLVVASVNACLVVGHVVLAVRTAFAG